MNRPKRPQLKPAMAVACFVALSLFIQGRAYAAQSRAEEGAICMRQGLASLDDLGIVALRPMLLGMLAEALGAAGRPQRDARR